ncbi:DUF4846 domain-containing protein [Mongoliitalea lutea]|uniref:DUF4846 domain-containing protein n=1 Tax=Mongoliitalea lutea TaxID=849756 RepID=A0A8J3CVW2_9BACT|nr:DUF4846 domain-containing protein [Mongoliitalea lutea]GHB36340.1 hypothetical protein GCM10008106_17030 [Mongoliitalea lutea]
MINQWRLGSALLLFILFPGLLVLAACKDRYSDTFDTAELAENNSARTIYERFPAPKGYQKTKAPSGSWEAYLQDFPLLPPGSPVLDYTGKPISDQRSHVAVLDIDVGKKDLQQCADAIIRLRAEYLWNKNQEDQIAFNFTSGHTYAWSAYASGMRPEVKGNQVSFKQTAAADNSYEAFRRYLDFVFMYAGTISLHRDMKQVNRKSEYQIGDVIVQPGSPGHAVIIVDKAKNAKGEFIYLLAQGFTPAQSVHIVKSGHSGISPWFKIPQSGIFWHKRFWLREVGVRRF